MALPILPVHLTSPPILTPPAPAALPATGGEAFQSVFSDAVAKVENFRAAAEDSVNKFLSGEGEELHTLAIKTQQAELSFDLFMQVRNKVVSAYQEVMRMQV
jgi:flagellar hook-basal body complex protein FliE